jgi:hypothetical protein
VLRFDPEPAEVYRALRKSAAQSDLFDRVRQVCSELNDDHGQAHLRRHRFTQPPLWYITVADRTETWVILWEQSPGDPADAIIRYIGPASFA